MTIPTHWLHIGSNIIQKDYFKPVIHGHLFNKPRGGLWASPLIEDGEYYSVWHDFIENEMYLGKEFQAVQFTLKDSARICIIDSQEDLIRFIKEVGTYTPPYPALLSIPIDFENACNYYDVIYLTERGQWKTRVPFENGEYNLYGWDVECCFIMNPDVIEQQQAIEIKGERKREKLELFE